MRQSVCATPRCWVRQIPSGQRARLTVNSFLSAICSSSGRSRAIWTLHRRTSLKEVVEAGAQITASQVSVTYQTNIPEPDAQNPGPSSQTHCPLSCRARRRSFPVHSSRPSLVREQNTSQTRNEYVPSSLTSRPTISHIPARLQGIVQDLKHACEAVISTLSEPLCAPLRAFTGRPASAAEAAVLDEAFRSACARDLRAGIARVRLYVPDARTAGVLVQHALDRVEDAYSAFSLAARQVGARAGKGQDCLMDDALLKLLLQEVRGDEADGAGSLPPVQA